jgi:RHS repeat-associated protein
MKTPIVAHRPTDGAYVRRSTSAYENEILFSGYRQDPATGLYHVRFRDYHPRLGR